MSKNYEDWEVWTPSGIQNGDTVVVTTKVKGVNVTCGPAKVEDMVIDVSGVSMYFVGGYVVRFIGDFEIRKEPPALPAPFGSAIRVQRYQKVLETYTGDFLAVRDNEGTWTLYNTKIKQQHYLSDIHIMKWKEMK